MSCTQHQLTLGGASVPTEGDTADDCNSQKLSIKPVAKRNALQYEKKKPPVKRRKFARTDFKSFEWLNPVKVDANIGCGDNVIDAAIARQQQTLDQMGVKPPLPKLITFLQERITFLEERNLLGLRIHDGSEAIVVAMHARSYLLNTPYLGKHIKGYKESLKDHGARWLKNTNFDDGDGYDQDNPPGWFVALDTGVLRTLLTLPRTAKRQRAWTPLGCDEALCVELRNILVDFDASVKASEKAAQKASEEKRREQAARAATAVVGTDSSKDVVRLQAVMGEVKEWTYDAASIAASATVSELGPPMSSNALRVWRALKLGLLTPVQVASQDYVPERCKNSRARRVVVVEQVADEECQQERSRNAQASPVAKTVLVHDDARPDAHTKVQNEREAREAEIGGCRRDQAFDASKVETPMIVATCDACGTEVWGQFLNCYCADRAWGFDGSWKLGYCRYEVAGMNGFLKQL